MKTIAGECRHLIPGQGTISREPCAAGVVPMSLRVLLTEERRQQRIAAGGASFGAAWPCHALDRKLFGLACDKCSPLSAEEAEAGRAAMVKMMDDAEASLATGACATCGAKLLRSGTAFACPKGCISGRACGPKDIRDAPPRSRWASRRS